MVLQYFRRKVVCHLTQGFYLTQPHMHIAFDSQKVDEGTSMWPSLGNGEIKVKGQPASCWSNVKPSIWGKPEPKPMLSSPSTTPKTRSILVT